MNLTFKDLADLGILIDVTSNIQKKHGTRQYKKSYYYGWYPTDLTIDSEGIVHEGSNSRPDEEHMVYKIIREFCLPGKDYSGTKVKKYIDDNVIPILEQHPKIESVQQYNSYFAQLTEKLCTTIIKDQKVKDLLRLRVYLIEQFGDRSKDFYFSPIINLYSNDKLKYIEECLSLDSTIDYDKSINDIIDVTSILLSSSSSGRDSFTRFLMKQFIEHNAIKAFKIYKTVNKDYYNIWLENSYFCTGIDCNNTFNLLNFKSFKLLNQISTRHFSIRKVSKDLNLSNKIYALKYICNNKITDKKYLSLIGKWDRLPALYKYDFNKIIDLLIKSNDELKSLFEDID